MTWLLSLLYTQHLNKYTDTVTCLRVLVITALTALTTSISTQKLGFIHWYEYSRQYNVMPIFYFCFSLYFSSFARDNNTLNYRGILAGE